MFPFDGKRRGSNQSDSSSDDDAPAFAAARLDLMEQAMAASATPTEKPAPTPPISIRGLNSSFRKFDDELKRREKEELLSHSPIQYPWTYSSSPDTKRHKTPAGPNLSHLPHRPLDSTRTPRKPAHKKKGKRALFQKAGTSPGDEEEDVDSGSSSSSPSECSLLEYDPDAEVI